MAYLHPLAYVLGLEGLALLRGFKGDYDQAFVLARLEEVRELLAAPPSRLGEPVTVEPVAVSDGYDSWADFYDSPGNQLVDIEQPVVWDILDRLPPGRALDAACGTGRHASYLAALGHEVIGVDASPKMLAKARAKLPDGDFHHADLHQLPLADHSVELVVCGLALNHVTNLAPVMAEFVRVLRPDGHLVISDSRGMIGDLVMPLVKVDADGRPGYLLNRQHLTSDYLTAALPLGLQVRSCVEPRRPSPLVNDEGSPPEETGEPPASSPMNIWSLHRWCVEATNAAYNNAPVAIVWHFQAAA